jgi:hypothetical protein
MTLELINPEGLVTAELRRRRDGQPLVFVAGQVATTRTGTSSATTISRRRPAKRSPTSAERLSAVGARPDHVAKLTIYVVGIASSTCPSSRRRGSRSSATTSRPT